MELTSRQWEKVGEEIQNNRRNYVKRKGSITLEESKRFTIDEFRCAVKMISMKDPPNNDALDVLLDQFLMHNPTFQVSRNITMVHGLVRMAQIPELGRLIEEGMTRGITNRRTSVPPGMVEIAVPCKFQRLFLNIDRDHEIAWFTVTFRFGDVRVREWANQREPAFPRNLLVDLFNDLHAKLKKMGYRIPTIRDPPHTLQTHSGEDSYYIGRHQYKRIYQHIDGVELFRPSVWSDRVDYPGTKQFGFYLEATK